MPFNRAFLNFCQGTLVMTAGAFTGLCFSFRTIPAGHIGYKNLFGNVYDKEYNPGFFFMNPFANLISMDLRKQVISSESAISSQEGLNIVANVDIIYRLCKENARQVYMNVGENYQNVLLIPQSKSIIRDTIAGYDAKALYTENTRAEIRTKIQNELVQKMISKGIIIEEVLLNQIILPYTLRESIEKKLQAEQEMQKMDFIVEKERKEAERKQIEAEGIQRFQNIVSRGVSKDLLQWKSIETAHALATSPNAKIIIMGDKTGLPMIFSP